MTTRNKNLTMITVSPVIHILSIYKKVDKPDQRAHPLFFVIFKIMIIIYYISKYLSVIQTNHSNANTHDHRKYRKNYVKQFFIAVRVIINVLYRRNI